MSKTRALQGHLTLQERDATASGRLLAAGASAALALCLGLLLVAALRPPEEATAEAPDALAVAPPEEAEAPAPPGAAPDEAPAAPAPPAAPSQEPPAEEPAPPAAEEPTPAPPAAEGQWWERARGQRCKVIFPDGQDRLVMREGSLSRDEVTSYGPFLDKPVVARVRRDDHPEVTVHHVGLHPRNSRPSLAFVTIHTADGDKQGILPLQISEAQVILQPTQPDR